jgi:hypothetical protein
MPYGTTTVIERSACRSTSILTAVVVCSLGAMLTLAVPREAVAGGGRVGKLKDAIEAITKALEDARVKYSAEPPSTDTSAADVAKQAGKAAVRAAHNDGSADKDRGQAQRGCGSDPKAVDSSGKASPSTVTAPAAWQQCLTDDFGLSGELLLRPQSQWVLKIPEGEAATPRK